ncbi:MAG: hypothetical protein K6F76_06445 [Clostridiales bacterium]|nr:hypothetical protein [Clostridiales bacterium]
MKKLLLIFIAASIMSVSMAACGDNGSGTSNTGIISNEEVTSAQVVPDKETYNVNDTVKCDVLLPKGNTTACRLLMAAAYTPLSDTENSVVLKDGITQSESVELSVDASWYVGECELRLASDDGVVARSPIQITDENSTYGTPQNLSFNNSYIKTEPENIYISDLRLIAERSFQLDTATKSSAGTLGTDKINFAVRIRIDGSEWSEPIMIDRKYVKFDQKKDGKYVDKISVLAMGKVGNGVASLKKNDKIAKIYDLFKDVLEVTIPSPGNNGVPYIDTTKHSVEICLCYYFDGVETSYTAPIAIGKGF